MGLAVFAGFSWRTVIFPSILAAVIFPSGAAIAAQQPAETPEGRVTFVAFNVQNYGIHPPEAAREPLKSEAGREAVAEVLASQQPSMIGLAEVACAPSLQDLQERLARRGIVLPHAFLLSGPDPDRCLAFLSRFPILENHSREHVAFELAGQPHAMQRGLLDVTVGLPGGMPVRMVGVHLKSKREVPDFDQEALRGREAREVRRHLDEIFQSSPGVPLIVWGDFNMLKNDAAWRVISGGAGSPHALRAVDASDSQGLNWTHHWEAGDLYSRIDFLLASATGAAMIVPGSAAVVDHTLGRLASDHRPLAITLSSESTSTNAHLP